MQFHSSKTKQTEFFETMRNAKIPKSLRGTLRPTHSALDKHPDEQKLENSQIPPSAMSTFQDASKSTMQNRSKTLMPLGTIINRHDSPTRSNSPSQMKPSMATNPGLKVQENNFEHLKSAMFRTNDQS